MYLLHPLPPNYYYCLYPSIPLPPSTATPSPPSCVLAKKRRTTIRCPNKRLGNGCCTCVSTQRRLCGVAVQHCYRSYGGGSPRRPGLSVHVPYAAPSTPCCIFCALSCHAYYVQQTVDRAANKVRSPATRQRPDSQK